MNKHRRLRAACFVYALLAYSGLSPWSGWRDLGLHPLHT
jgi:hypothetical protein